MPRKKNGGEGRFYREAEVRYLPSGSNEIKLWESEAVLAGGLF